MTATDLIELTSEELHAIVNEAGSRVLSPAEVQTLQAAVSTLEMITYELEKKRVSLAKLRKMLFGPTSEKTNKVFGDEGDGDQHQPDPEEQSSGRASEQSPNDDGSNSATPNDEQHDSDRKESDENVDDSDDEKRPGHGRNGADAYTGAENVNIPHPTLSHGSRCPDCDRGNVYRRPRPGIIVRLRGQAPIQATVYELEKLRCNACGCIFTASPPPDIGDKKYDETAVSMNGLVKYGHGMPFNRLEALQGSMGVPLPASTQWDNVSEAAQVIRPAFDEMIRQAAQGTVLHSDDTTMKILELMGLSRENKGKSDDSTSRTGIFTTGIVSLAGEQTIALFFTGNRHAGENLEKVLAMRAKKLDPPIHMSDSLSRNLPGDFETIWANCNAHARRNFVDVANGFPVAVRHVLEVFRELYGNESHTREANMSSHERLRYHQVHSGPLMETFKAWLNAQIEQKKVEPNSGLGDAIKYMLKHWDKLMRFLEVPGAPLDNNICERALKKAILHRKNALFYKTENGALVGDIFMSLIYTACLSGANPFDYLTELQRNASALVQNPEQWMPWNYRTTLAYMIAA